MKFYTGVYLGYVVPFYVSEHAVSQLCSVVLLMQHASRNKKINIKFSLSQSNTENLISKFIEIPIKIPKVGERKKP